LTRVSNIVFIDICQYKGVANGPTAKLAPKVLFKLTKIILTIRILPLPIFLIPSKSVSYKMADLEAYYVTDKCLNEAYPKAEKAAQRPHDIGR